jgi:hypothetical protein
LSSARQAWREIRLPLLIVVKHGLWAAEIRVLLPRIRDFSDLGNQFFARRGNNSPRVQTGIHSRSRLTAKLITAHG